MGCICTIKVGPRITIFLKVCDDKFNLILTVMVSAPAGEAPQTIEVTLYLSGSFQSAVCRSPEVSSPAPYWSVNDNILKDKELNLLYDATVSRSNAADGRYLATLTIPALSLTLNGSRISCSVNMTVLLEYHLHLIEGECLNPPREGALGGSPGSSPWNVPYCAIIQDVYR